MDSILNVALQVAGRACKNAEEEFGLEAGFYSMQQAEVEGRKCLILSVVLCEASVSEPQRVEFLGFREPYESRLDSSSVRPS